MPGLNLICLLPVLHARRGLRSGHNRGPPQRTGLAIVSRGPVRLYMAVRACGQGSTSLWGGGAGVDPAQPLTLALALTLTLTPTRRQNGARNRRENATAPHSVLVFFKLNFDLLTSQMTLSHSE